MARFKSGGFGGGFGFNENEWAETVAQNLQKILERMDTREEAYRTLRDDVKLFLDGFQPDPQSPEKLRVIQSTDPVNYGLLMDIIEGFYPAVPSPYWILIDLVSNRVIEINKILVEEKKLDKRVRDRLHVKLREWLGYGIYEVQKITITEIEKRESRLRDSTIGILARDAAPLLGKGDVGRETKKYIRGEADVKNFEDGLYDDDEEDDEVEEDLI